MDNDPAGVATYSVIGAQSSSFQHWLLLFSTPLLIVIQQMSARTANVTKTNLSTTIRIHCGRPVAIAIVMLAVAANIPAVAGFGVRSLYHFFFLQTSGEIEEECGVQSIM